MNSSGRNLHAEREIEEAKGRSIGASSPSDLTTAQGGCRMGRDLGESSRTDYRRFRDSQRCDSTPDEMGPSKFWSSLVWREAHYR